MLTFGGGIPVAHRKTYGVFLDALAFGCRRNEERWPTKVGASWHHVGFHKLTNMFAKVSDWNFIIFI